MATTTWLGSGIPAVQALPVEHSTPWASSSMSRASASQPSKSTLVMPGSEPPEGVSISASGTASCTAATSSARNCDTVSPDSSLASPEFSDARNAAAMAEAPATSRVPEWIRRS